MIIIKAEKAKSVLVEKILNNTRQSKYYIYNDYYFNTYYPSVYIDSKEVSLNKLQNFILDDIKDFEYFNDQYIVIYTNLPEEEIKNFIKDMEYFICSSMFSNLIITCK